MQVDSNRCQRTGRTNGRDSRLEGLDDHCPGRRRPLGKVVSLRTCGLVKKNEKMMKRVLTFNLFKTKKLAYFIWDV